MSPDALADFLGKKAGTRGFDLRRNSIDQTGPFAGAGRNCPALSGDPGVAENGTVTVAVQIRST